MGSTGDRHGFEDVHHDEQYFRGGLVMGLIALTAAAGIQIPTPAEDIEVASEQSADASTDLSTLESSLAALAGGQSDESEFGPSSLSLMEDADVSVAVYPSPSQPGTWTFEDPSAADATIATAMPAAAGDWEEGLVDAKTNIEYRQLLVDLTRVVSDQRIALDATAYLAFNQGVITNLTPQQARDIVSGHADAGTLARLDAIVQLVFQASALTAAPTTAPVEVADPATLDVVEEIAKTQREIADLLAKSQNAPESEWAEVLDLLSPASLAKTFLGMIIGDVFKSFLTWVKGDDKSAKASVKVAPSTSAPTAQAERERRDDPFVAAIIEAARQEAQRQVVHILRSATGPRHPDESVDQMRLLALAFWHDKMRDTGFSSFEDITVAVGDGLRDALSEFPSIADPPALAGGIMANYEDLVDRLM